MQRLGKLQILGFAVVVSLLISLGVALGGGALGGLQPFSGSTPTPQLGTIPGSVSPVIAQKGVQNEGPAPSSAQVSFTVIFALQNQAELNTLVKNIYTRGSADYMKFLTAQQFHEMFSPPLSAYGAVMNYLQSQGLKITYTSDNRLMIGAEGSLAQVADAFHTSFGLFKLNSTEFYANTKPVELPIGDGVVAVGGLTNFTLIRPTLVQAPGAQGVPLDKLPAHLTSSSPSQIGSQDGPYIPQQVQAAYGLTALWRSVCPGHCLMGNKTTIGIVDAYTAPDLMASYNFFNGFFLLPNSTLNVLYPTGVPTASGAATGWLLETLLDTQWAHSMAPNATIDLYLAYDNGFALFESVNSAVDSQAVNVLSQSWGMPEPFMTSQLAHALDQIYEQAASEGISVFASAGDSSADNGLGFNNVIYPASDPFVTAVGGTTSYFGSVSGISPSARFSAGGGRINETAWSTNNLYGWGTGGGQSMYFSCPWYQTASLAYHGFSGTATCGVQGTVNRTIPDVSALANPFTGAWVADYYNGFIFALGGTSLASPVWAGIIAVMDGFFPVFGLPIVPVGLLNAPLYSFGSNLYYNPGIGETGWVSSLGMFPPAPLNDVIEGNNGAAFVFQTFTPGYNATVGYDPVTGWGTPNALGFFNFYRLVTGFQMAISPSHLLSSSLPATVQVAVSTSPTCDFCIVTISSSPSIFTPVVLHNLFTMAYGSFTVPAGTRSGEYQIIATYHGGSQNVTLTVGPTLTLNTTTAHQGSVVGAQGLGFKPSSSATVYVEYAAAPAQELSVSTNSTGGFKTAFTVPAQFAYSAEVIANDSAGNQAIAPLILEPYIQLSTTSVQPGNSVGITGVTFSYASPQGVNIYLNGTYLTTFDANGYGDFSGTFTVPGTTPAGNYVVTAIDSLGYNASAPLTVKVSALIAAAESSSYYFMSITPGKPGSQEFFTNSSGGTVQEIEVYLSGTATVQVGIGSSPFSSNLFSGSVSVNGAGWYVITLPTPLTLQASSSYYLTVSVSSGSVSWAYSATYQTSYSLNDGARYYYNNIGRVYTTLSTWLFQIRG